MAGTVMCGALAVLEAALRERHVGGSIRGIISILSCPTASASLIDSGVLQV
jgi:hypothetical protein